MSWAPYGKKRVFSNEGWTYWGFSQAAADKKLLRGWAKGFGAPESQERHLKLETALEEKLFFATTLNDFSEPKRAFTAKKRKQFL